MKREKFVCEVFSPSEHVEEVRGEIPDLSKVVGIFKVLSDETRAKLVYLLGSREMCVCDLATVLQVTLPAISHHLRLLKAHGLVKSRREGKMMMYSLQDSHTVGIIQEARDAIKSARDEEMADYAL
jgi:ArsR family transcriptional regulator